MVELVHSLFLGREALAFVEVHLCCFHPCPSLFCLLLDDCFLALKPDSDRTINLVMYFAEFVMAVLKKAFATEASLAVNTTNSCKVVTNSCKVVIMKLYAVIGGSKLQQDHSTGTMKQMIQV